MKLTWGAANDNSGSVSYQILRNDRVVATTTGTSITVPKGGENRFFVRAVDAAGNLSASSPAVVTSGGNPSPVAAFTSAADGWTENFDASGSTDNGSIADYAWNFGDGSTGSGATASHTYATAGTYQVRLVVTDNGGERAGLMKTLTIVQPAPKDAYGAAVYGENPTLYYRLGDGSGTTAADSSTSDSPGTYSGGVTLDSAGELPGAPDTAATFDGTSGLVASRKSYDNPSTYSLELWFNTTTTRGGKLIGFGDQSTGTSNNYDRHVYMQDDGRLVFGTWTGQPNTITSPIAYNDGKWHLMVATQSSDGMVLYVDGAQVGTNPQTQAQPYSGYWRIGGDTTWGSSSPFFAGTLDEAAVYPTALTAAKVAQRYHLGGGNLAPAAAFGSTVSAASAAFDASGSTDDGSIASYAWDFGDGTTGTGVTTTHVFSSAGTYQVMLTLTDDLGLTSSVTHPVAIIRPAPSDAYGAAIYRDGPTLYYRLGESGGAIADDSSPAGSAGDYSGGVTQGAAGGLPGGAGTAATFDGNSGLVASRQSYSNPSTYSLEVWFNTSTTRGGKLIGFGSSATGTSGSYDRHVYMQDDGHLVFGTYTGQLNTITTPAAYNDGMWHSVVATQSSAGMVLYVDGVEVGTNPQTAAQNYTGYWRIGGDTTWGSSSSFLAGTLDEAAVYPSALTSDQVATHYRIGTTVPPVNKVPVASFTSTAKDLGITVDGSGSSDPDGTVDSYAWDFGDGTTGQGATVTHTYTAAGPYTVKLTVTDDQGATGEKTDQVTVTAPPVNKVPVTSFTSTAKDLGITVDGSGSSDPDGTVDSYAWDFGDGTTGQGATVTHTYTAAGPYTVKLTVTDDQGATGEKTDQVTVTAPPVNKVPVASFTSTAKDLGITVDGSGSSDPDGTVDSYAWDFGDGTTGQGATATHTYTAAGPYTVKLTVTDDQGATGEKTDQVTVTAPASVDVVAVPVKSTWSWRNEATAPPSGWKGQGFDASSWKTGDGVLGLGSTGAAVRTLM